MSQHPPKSLIKSRENLQKICKNLDRNTSGIIKYEIFDRFLLVLWQNIKRLFDSYNPPLKYIINPHEPSYHIDRFVFTEANISELIELLKNEYPGVDFTYKETAGYDGKIIERIIIMDWS